MSPTLILSLIAGYFVILIIIALLTSRKATSESFFVANRNAPWYMVAFAMIGTSLSGVTFISVPGMVHRRAGAIWPWLLGYLVGYVVIGTGAHAAVLPAAAGVHLYVSGAALWVLELQNRGAFLPDFAGRWARLCGCIWWRACCSWLCSMLWACRSPYGDCQHYAHLPLHLQGRPKTILWTDTFQTLAMLTCVGVSIYLMSSRAELWASRSWCDTVNEQRHVADLFL